MSVADSVSLRELNQHAGRVIAEVREGRETIITDRGTPVAKIVPIDHARTPLQRLIALGLVTEPVGDAWRPDPVALPDGLTTHDLLLEDRV